MIKEGSLIQGPFWNEPVRVERIDEIGDYLHIVGYTTSTRQHVDHLVPRDQLAKLQVVERVLDFSAHPEEFFLVAEATRLQHASLFDPLLAMSVSRVDPLPFQIEAVYDRVLKQPRIRFLIADDPGAGKTIMAGLVLKELKLRKLARRILIVVPGHLKDQWRRELKDKFDERFMVIDRNTFNASYGETPWERESQVITSIDFAKQEDILHTLRSVSWDLVIVDEAHKMSAYRYGEKTAKTQRYRLGEVLSETSNHLLFLTATPHKGDPENFRLFLDLLVPGFFATSSMIEESLKNKDNPLFIRRLKEDLRDFEGKPIFTGRFPKTIRFHLSEAEKELYNELSRYVAEQYTVISERSDSREKRNVTFALMILQRRMASSTYALLRSLERRKARLEKILKMGEKEEWNVIPQIDLEEVEDLEEKERWEKEEEWEALTAAENPEALQQEIGVIDLLIEKARRVIKSEEEVKLRELKKAIEEGFEKIKEMNGNPKILIFTESRDTLEYLVEKIQRWGYRVNFIHGGMNIEERVRAEKEFRDQTEVMVATEAAGEGINLQFCHIMINYDIPWNPNRLEQRMGRIHRYGQQKDVYIFNLVADDTREGKVLARLLEKLDEIRRKLGSDRVFDIIGEIFEGKKLHQLLLDAVVSARNMDEILQELDIQPDEAYITRVKNMLGESLATRFIDYQRIREMTEKAKEHRLVPEYVEAFFKKAFVKAGGKFRESGKFLAIDSVPYVLRRIAEDVSFKNRYGEMLRSYPKVTFDKNLASKNPDAEFVSFGHPLLEALLIWVIREFQEQAKKGAVFKDSSGKLDGYLFFYLGEVQDGKGEIAGRKLLVIYDDGKTQKEVSPALLWDLAFASVERSDGPSFAASEELFDGKRLLPFALQALEKYREEIASERKRQAEIKRKYGLHSLKHFIRELDSDLAELYERQAQGEKVDLPIRNKEERKRRYEEAARVLEDEIEKEQSLSMRLPELLMVARVVPERASMVEDAEIERIGMEIAMRYERRQGRNPEDVSSDNSGYDIRSIGDGEVRYIEVKARAGEGEVALTPNEWFAAERLGKEYWLYVVANAATKPTLYLVNDPASGLNPQEKVEIVRFVVPASEWKAKAGEAWRE
ncbi:helicase-related protein [Thermatribacter velox]|uniref:Helicase-related protein n=1 Tax=Thermatribacter velox TaxID=3039681 RepID=A0ABZ2YB72_9BACT